MSSAVVSTSAALGRPFVFDDDAVSEVYPEIPDLFSAGRHPQRAHLADSDADCKEASQTRDYCVGSFAFAQDFGSGLQLRSRPLTPQLRAARSGPSAGKSAHLRLTSLAVDDPKLASITPASHLNIRPAPEMASSGIPAIDALAGGLPRGCLTEICGPASSGRTTVLLAALATATRRGEFCVLVDTSDALDPHSVAAAGVELERLLWVRCGESSPQKLRAKENLAQAAFKFGETGSRQAEHRLEQLLRATDMLLESGGFGLIVLDLCDLPLQAARHIPLTTWFRYRRAVEHTPTVLLTIEQHPIAGSCSSLLLNLGPTSNRMLAAQDEPTAKRRKNAAHGPSTPLRVNPRRGLAAESDEAPEERKNIFANGQTAASPFVEPTHAQLLTGLEITAELIRSRLERKPARSTSAFASKTAWAG